MANEGLIRVKREGAARSRRLSKEVSSPQDRERMLAYADELDAQADALEEAARIIDAKSEKDKDSGVA